jgi:multidrug resistance efflux pump
VSRRLAIAAIVVIAALVTAWVGYRYRGAAQERAGEVVASGTFAAIGAVAVRATVPGEVTEINADFNTPVQRGQVLARIARRGAKDQESTAIRAPIDGTVILRNISPGQSVGASPQAPALFSIAPDLHEMQLEAALAAADAARLRVGMPASFAVEAFPRRSFSGEVLQIRKSAAKGQRAAIYTVLLAAANPELVLLPGMTATVRITTEAAR